MAIIDICDSHVGADRWYRTNTTSSWAGLTSSLYENAKIGFMYDQPDYIMYEVSSSYYHDSTPFNATVPDYVFSGLTISGTTQIGNIEGFVPARVNYATMSNDIDHNSMISTFSAVSADYIMMTASIDIRETIVLNTQANVEPDQPDFPPAPSVGSIDLNRYRKTYTHVRVRPRIRKYSTVQ